jgi:hypothetical protein
MPGASEIPTVGPALVRSIADELERRRANPPALDKVAAAAEKLIKDMRGVKRSRFNARDRFEAKHSASIVAFTLASVCQIGLALFVLRYGEYIQPEMRRFFEFACDVTSIFTMAFGLVVGLKNYQIKALQMQRCAMDVSNLLRKLEIALPVEREILQQYRRKYHQIDARCPENHSDIDYKKSRLAVDDVKGARWIRWEYRIDVYGVYWFVGAMYLSFWAAFWLFLRS